ncbi:MAG: nitroreductase family protein [Candidatus Bathyarchaeia archaeon]
MKNPVLENISRRRSIRRFKPKPVSRKAINQIVEAAQRAPTACGMQTYSFILITNQQIRKEIYNAIGEQQWMKQAPVWIMICADMTRQLQLFKLLRVETRFGPLSMLLSAVIDAALAAENMVIAADALGLGSVFIGSVWGNLKGVAKILKLPKSVLPIVLICLGYPNENPPTRPRWPLEAVLHENEYKMPSKELMKKYYTEANQQLVEMRYFRRGVRNWAEHWQRKFPLSEMNKWEKQLREDLRELGFVP